MEKSDQVIEFRRGDLVVSTDRTKLDVDLIHRFLSTSYWAGGIPKKVVLRSIENSLCFGVFSGARQVGFARVITDCSTFAYLADVFITQNHRGLGLAKFLLECILKHPDVQGLRRWSLATRDAHGLYAQFGFTPLREPDRFMERHNPDAYDKELEG
jgi:GNAT superfamily N-acetyltransferase